MKIFKNYFLLFVFILSFLATNAQEKNKPYHPEANAKLELKNAVEKAKLEDKYVFIQIGGNWCSWCLMLHNLYTEDSEIDSIINANYVKMMLNYSRENKNLDLLEDLGYPQRFGFPVIVILNDWGKVIHIQNTVCLEEGKGYNKKRFIEFLNNWSKTAFNPENYKE